ncbi:glycosyl hydrolase family 18 protein [Streptomyces sp. NPDC059070]|uniref:glycosyl hydrolase family 18 protein n=1 Tax=unclassified Streptomyces TaxID=2593676 RepID=UPI0034E2597B
MIVRVLAALCAALLALLTSPPAAFAEEPAPPGTVSAWLPYWDQEGAYQDALRHAAQLHTVSPFWYRAVAAERVDGHPGAGDRRVVDGLHAAGIAVVPTVMETMEPGVLAAILADPARRAAHVDTLVGIVRGHAYDGLDIDYESIAPTGDAAYQAVRADYAAFVTGLCARLHALAKKCVSTVSPQTAATGRIWDYAALGRAADRVRIMAYDRHWSGGDPGPLAGVDWYEEILRRATALIPADRIELALPGYGWDWPAGGGARARHVTWREAEALRKAQGAPYALDPVSKTPHFTYRDANGTAREVWYQDARGVEACLPLLARYGVRGTSLWALDFEDPALWPVLART